MSVVQPWINKLARENVNKPIVVLIFSTFPRIPRPFPAMFEDNIYEDGFGEDEDLLNQPIQTEDGENIEDPEGGDLGGGAGAGQKVEVKIKKKRDIIRPIDRFMGDRGLQSVGEYYKGVKYKGKNREAEDLNLIMGRMQHWAHRAFPKMKFDDALTIVEGLAKKRIIQTHMTKYRMDMLQPAVIQADEENPEEQDMTGVQPMDEFDDLLGDQIEQMTRVQKAKAHSTALNNTSMMNQSDVSLGVSAIPRTPQPVKKPPTSTLSSDQMAKIAENRLKALERLKQKQLEAAAEQPQSPPGVNDSISLMEEED